jgi:hypothetical protein
MDITIFPRRERSSLEDELHKLESTMVNFGLKLAISKQVPGQYSELLYETSSRGGIMAQYRLDDAPKFQMNIEHVKKSNVPLDQVPKVVEVDNVLYSIGMSTEFFNSVCAYLQR